MKHKIRMLSIAMATIVLISMVAATGVSAAKPATVGAPITGAFAACYDGSNVWIAVQGVANAQGNTIYYMKYIQPWNPIGTGTNPSIVSVGTAGNVAIFARGTDSTIWGKKTADGGTTWSNVGMPTSAAAAGTGPLAVYNPNANQIDVFFVASGTNHLVVDTLDMNLAMISQTDLGGVVFATPAAVLTSTGGIDVVVKGTGGVIYEKMNTMASWGGYTKFHDGRIGAGASLVRDAAGNINLFVAGADGHLYALQSTNGGLTWYVPNPVLRPGVLGWLNLGGILTSPPVAIAVGATLYVGARGGDGGIWYETGAAPYTATTDWFWSATSIAGP